MDLRLLNIKVNFSVNIISKNYIVYIIKMYEKLKRPAFLYNTGVQIEGNAPSIEAFADKRQGNGNDKITRPAFYQAEVQPRNLLNFDKLTAIDLTDENQMIRDRDGDKMAIFNVRFPDPLDSMWIQEKNRIVADLKSKNNRIKPSEIEAFLQLNKPLGRDQRTIIKKTNLFDSNMSLQRTIDIMYDELNSNQYVSNILQNTVKHNLERVMTKGKTLKKLQRKTLEELDYLIRKTKIPISHSELGLIPRFIDYNYYMANAGKINLLLFSNVASSKPNKNYNYEYLVKNLTTTGSRGYTLQEALYLMAEGNKNDEYFYMDLHLCGIIDEEQLTASINALTGKWDSEQVSIEEGSRPQGWKIEPVTRQASTKSLTEDEKGDEGDVGIRGEKTETEEEEDEDEEEKKHSEPQPPAFGLLPFKPVAGRLLSSIKRPAPPRYDLPPNMLFYEEMKRKHPSFSDEKLKEFSKKTFDRLSLTEKKDLISKGRVKLTPAQTVFYLEKRGRST
jgi:hypothetical protein